ncbi:phosphonate C-P lyase system protein PhnH [Advenella sp. WQ 585]|uniref:Phosphonate C-P lyase system protein PhnH n=1 Tax=Advenella mandrilli TaxID=2800330 RepID=A0ABS1EF31_9BURK|nr:phosphonate C-P lyase system protein PhnH [Advenella mandrilli]MBK1781933.1 phosphonate C-P lyase system protein PhnH [Advenella mandrilli]
MNSHYLKPAFDNPVSGSQQSFRLALKAMAEPGLPYELRLVETLDTLAPASYALALTLLDSDTAVWLSPALDTPAIRANLAFHCACPVVEQPQDADFALMLAAETGVIASLNAGTDRDPELSCTALIQLDSFEGGLPTLWQGPGIETQRQLCLPVDKAFWQIRQAVTAFPCGIDMFFIAGEQIMALSRSTQVNFQVEN